MAQVFISYAEEDRDRAELVQSKLRLAGHGTSMDIDLLRAGDAWQAKLDQAIRASHAAVVIMTPKARRSDYVTYEWAFALGAGVRVIALDYVKKDLHPRLDTL